MNHKHNEHLYVIDASIFIFRYYFSMPPNWHSSSGRPTETVYGYLQWLLRFLTEQKPGRVVVCFDESLGSCFRNEIYADYKSSRALPDDDLCFQLLACKKVTEFLGLFCVASDVFEADDLIGTYANYCCLKNLPCTILTRDKDLGQLLLSDDICLWDFPDGDILDHKKMEAKIGVRPHQIPDYLALVGDKSDDIPGVPGIGGKTASLLLSRFNDWNEIAENIDDIHTLPIRGALRIQEKIKEFRSQIDMSLLLSTVALDACDVIWPDTERKAADVDNLLPFLVGLGFPKTINKKIDLLVNP